MEISKSQGFYEKNNDDLIGCLPEYKDKSSVTVLDLEGKEEDLKKKLQNENLNLFSAFVDRDNFETTVVDSDNIKTRKRFYLNNLADSENIYDCIYIGEQLTQLNDPWEDLIRLRKSLKDDGYVLVTVPNIGNYGVLYYLLMGRWQYMEESILDKQNIRFFTLHEAIQMFSKAGFVVDHLSANFSPPHPMMHQMSDLVKVLGGDPQKFIDETQVCQYLFRLKKEKADYKVVEESKEEAVQIDERHKEAYSLYVKQMYPEAAKVYLSILRDNENDTKALIGLAKSFENVGSHKFADKCYIQLLKVEPSAMNCLEYAQFQIRLGQHSEVIRILKQFLVDFSGKIEKKDHIEILKIIGNSFMQLTSYNEAENYYKEALSLEPDNQKQKSILFINMGTVDIQRNNNEAAKKWYEEALNTGESKSKAYSGLGLVALSNNIEEAKEYFKKSLEEDITTVVSIFHLVKIAYDEKNFTDIALSLEKYLQVKPKDNEMRFTLAGIYFELGRMSEAEEQCNKILAQDVNNKNAAELINKINNENLRESTLTQKIDPEGGICEPNL